MRVRVKERVLLEGESFSFRRVVKKATENGGDTSDRLILCYNCVYKRSADSSRKIAPSIRAYDGFDLHSKQLTVGMQ